MYRDYDMFSNYYGINNMYRTRQDASMYEDELITLYQAIELIRQSVLDEKNGEMFYSVLIEQAPTEKDKDIISSIRENEIKHNNILRDLYYNLTGQMIPMNYSEPTMENNNLSYEENLEKALFGELDAVVKYRKILGTMPSGRAYTLIMSILTDELRHASKYNYLIHMASEQNIEKIEVSD